MVTISCGGGVLGGRWGLVPGAITRSSASSMAAAALRLRRSRGDAGGDAYWVGDDLVVFATWRLLVWEGPCFWVASGIAGGGVDGVRIGCDTFCKKRSNENMQIKLFGHPLKTRAYGTVPVR